MRMLGFIQDRQSNFAWMSFIAITGELMFCCQGCHSLWWIYLWQLSLFIWKHSCIAF